jgi:hypothetical protein
MTLTASIPPSFGGQAELPYDGPAIMRLCPETSPPLPTRSRPFALLLAAALTVAACSARDSLDPKSGLRISIEDPGRRLGEAPWSVAVFNPYLGPEEKLSVWAAGQASPGRAYVVLRRDDEDVWRILDFTARDELDFGLVLGALRADGYWLARLKHGASGGETTGVARFCRWGTIVPEEGAEALEIRARPVKKDHGLEYEVTARVPPAGAR